MIILVKWKNISITFRGSGVSSFLGGSDDWNISKDCNSKILKSTFLLKVLSLIFLVFYSIKLVSSSREYRSQIEEMGLHIL